MCRRNLIFCHQSYRAISRLFLHVPRMVIAICVLLLPVCAITAQEKLPKGLNDKNIDKRTKALNKITSEDLLATLALESLFGDVRVGAIDRISTEALLEKIAFTSGSPETRLAAAAKVKDQSALTRIAFEDADSNVEARAAARLTEQSTLVKLALQTTNANVAREILPHITDQSSIAKVALDSRNPAVNFSAVEALFDQELLLKIARDSKLPEVRRAAVKKLSDASTLNRIRAAETDSSVRGAVTEKLATLAKPQSGEMPANPFVAWGMIEAAVSRKMNAESTSGGGLSIQFSMSNTTFRIGETTMQKMTDAIAGGVSIPYTEGFTAIGWEKATYEINAQLDFMFGPPPRPLVALFDSDGILRAVSGAKKEANYP